VPVSAVTSGCHQGDMVARLRALPGTHRWLDHLSHVCSSAGSWPCHLGGPEPRHSPLLLQSSCAILATILYLKIASPRPRAIAYFSLFFFLTPSSLPVPSCPAAWVALHWDEQMLHMLLVAAGSGSLPLALPARTGGLRRARAPACPVNAFCQSRRTELRGEAACRGLLPGGLSSALCCPAARSALGSEAGDGQVAGGVGLSTTRQKQPPPSLPLPLCLPRSAA